MSAETLFPSSSIVTLCHLYIIWLTLLK